MLYSLCGLLVQTMRYTFCANIHTQKIYTAYELGFSSKDVHDIAVYIITHIIVHILVCRI